MTDGVERINDELLSAWVDGELGPVEHARVQDWLRLHPQDMARVKAWAADRAALGEMCRPLVEDPVPAALAKTVWRRRAPSGWALAASAAGLILTGALIGGASAWHWEQQQHALEMAQLRTQLAIGTAQGWVERAAFAHDVYVAEPRHAVEVKAQEEHLSRWLTRRIGIPVKLFDLREHGFELVGGRLLPDGPGKSAQLMYEDAQRHRVTVYLRKPETGTDAEFRYERHGELGMFYWIEEGAGYALVGGLPKGVLLALARSIYRQHPGTEAPAPASSASDVPRR